MINIADRLHSTATEQTVAGANEIYDDAKGKKQDVINQENDEHFSDIENESVRVVPQEFTQTEQQQARTNLNTYSKEEVNHIASAFTEQNYVTVQAVAATTAADIPTLINATGDGEQTDTIYRVGWFDGTAFDATKYSLYTWNGTAYIQMAVRSSIGEVFDISVYNTTGGTPAQYETLALALGTNGANVPSGVRQGGMSVKYIQSSDNKYVQARCMANTFTTNVTQWQVVEKEPTAGSDNLVNSGGIAKSLGIVFNGSINKTFAGSNIPQEIKKDFSSPNICFIRAKVTNITGSIDYIQLNFRKGDEFEVNTFDTIVSGEVFFAVCYNYVDVTGYLVQAKTINGASFDIEIEVKNVLPVNLINEKIDTIKTSIDAEIDNTNNVVSANKVDADVNSVFTKKEVVSFTDVSCPSNTLTTIKQITNLQGKNIINAKAYLQKLTVFPCKLRLNFIFEDDSFEVNEYEVNRNNVILEAFTTNNSVKTVVLQATRQIKTFVCSGTLSAGVKYSSKNRFETCLQSGISESIAIDKSTGANVTRNLFPTYCRKNCQLKVNVSFDSFSQISFGRGLNAYRGAWWVLDGTNIVEHRYFYAGTSGHPQADMTTTYQHGLTIKSPLSITVEELEDERNVQKLTIYNGDGNTYVLTMNGEWGGTPFFKPSMTCMLNRLSFEEKDRNKKLWLYGDSYMEHFWLEVLQNKGYLNYFASYRGGATSPEQGECLISDVRFGSPETIVWGLGMNDGDDISATEPNATWLQYAQKIATICSERNINLIFLTIPTCYANGVYQRDNRGKNYWIRNSGYNYIDFANLMEDGNGNWYTGFRQSNTDVHPSTLGCNVLAGAFVTNINTPIY